MSWLAQSSFKRAYGLTRQWQTPPSLLAASSSRQSLLAPHRITLRSRSSIAPFERLTNNDIPFKLVRLADPESGSLRPMAPLRTILSSIDPKTHHVELVADRPEPVVKIINTKEARDKYRDAKKRAQAVARAQVRKEIQVTWGVAAGDLAHKLEKVRQGLVGGRKVDLIFAIKKGQVAPTKQDMDARVNGALETLADAGREYLPRKDWKNMVVLHLKPLGQS